MFRFVSSRIAWLGIGLLGGLILGGMWPQTPLHAVATDRSKSFAMATGPVDEEVEAVYFLDFLTGDLTAVVMGRQGNGFTAFFRYNVLDDLEVNPSKNPQYLMATGMVNLRRGASRQQPSVAAVYVSEVTSGQLAAYVIPWNKGAYAAGRVQPPAQLVPLGKTPFRAMAPPAVEE